MNRLHIFLFLLMRDEVSTGTVAKLIRDASAASELEVDTDAPELEALAKRYADRLTG